MHQNYYINVFSIIYSCIAYFLMQKVNGAKFLNTISSSLLFAATPVAAVLPNDLVLTASRYSSLFGIFISFINVSELFCGEVL